MRESHVRSMCRTIELTSLTDESENFRIPNFGQSFRAQIEEDWGHKVCWLMLGYDQNVVMGRIFIKPQNWPVNYRQLFHCPTSVECLRLDCKVVYTDSNQWIMPESHTIWVQFKKNDVDNTFQCCVPSFSVVYFTRTPPNQILQFQEWLPTGKTISPISKWCNITQQWKLCPQAQ